MIVLKTSAGEVPVVQEGESARLEITFTFDGTAIVAANITAATLTLYDQVSGLALNERNGQDVLDTNDGSLGNDGVLTVKLGPDDNAIVTAAVGQRERHIARFEWEWLDADGDTQSGTEEFEFRVEKLQTVTTPA